MTHVNISKVTCSTAHVTTCTASSPPHARVSGARDLHPCRKTPRAPAAMAYVPYRSVTQYVIRVVNALYSARWVSRRFWLISERSIRRTSQIHPQSAEQFFRLCGSSTFSEYTSRRVQEQPRATKARSK